MIFLFFFVQVKILNHDLHWMSVIYANLVNPV